MANKIRGYQVNVEKWIHGPIEFEDSLDNIYRILNVDTIDIVNRQIGGKQFVITVDDNGLLKNNFTVSAKNPQYELVGNLLITNVDPDSGEFASLSDEDVQIIYNAIVEYDGTKFYLNLGEPEKKKNAAKPSCWDCIHAVGTHEDFLEYGEESAKGECGTNYGVECSKKFPEGSEACQKAFVPRSAFPEFKLNELAHYVHDVAIDHEWWSDPPRSFGEQIALCHSELSETLEEYRDNHEPTEIYYNPESDKPEGIPMELADTVIRILDMCEFYGIDLEAAIMKKMAYNVTRPPRHGGKRL